MVGTGGPGPIEMSVERHPTEAHVRGDSFPERWRVIRVWLAGGVRVQ